MAKANPFAKGAPKDAASKGAKVATIIAINVKPTAGKKAPVAPPKKGNVPKGFVPFTKKGMK